jgi:hypothetical protein
MVMTIMKNENLLNYFRLFCVDDNLDKIPPQIKKVPTLIVNGIGRPLVADEIFEWIKKTKFFMSKKPQTEQPAIIQKEQPADKKLLGYVESEMNGFSDTFAFTNVDVAIPHRFIEYGDDDKHTIFTAPQEPSELKLSGALQTRKINDMKKTREKQEQEYKQTMKDQQLYALYLSNKNE